MSFWDKLTGAFASPDGVSAAIMTGASLFNNLWNQPETPYAQSEDYAQLQAQLEREKLAQQMQIAQMQIAAQGAGTGAAMAAVKERMLANALAAKLRASENVGQAYQAGANTLLSAGSLGQSGLNQVAQAFLSGRK